MLHKQQPSIIATIQQTEHKPKLINKKGVCDNVPAWYKHYPVTNLLRDSTKKLIFLQSYRGLRYYWQFIKSYHDVLQPV